MILTGDQDILEDLLEIRRRKNQDTRTLEILSKVETTTQSFKNEGEYVERKGGKDFLQMGLSIRTSYEGAPGIKPNETKRNETKRNV